MTIDADIHDRILHAAARGEVSVSAWMTAAAREALSAAGWLGGRRLVGRAAGTLATEEMHQAQRNVRAQLRKSRTVPCSA
jgi:hypothetical protein